VRFCGADRKSDLRGTDARPRGTEALGQNALVTPSETLDYARRIDVRTAPGRVVAEMEDYVHHFRVELEHADGVVTRAVGTGVRVPWATCPIGAAGVARLAGAKVGPGTGDSWVGSDRTDQCTHVIDLAAVAVAHAGRPSIRYDARVSPAGGPRRRAVLVADGRPVLEWELDNDVVQSGPFAGLAVRSRELKRRMRELTDADQREYVAILRRACHIAPSRAIDLDDYEVAAQIGTIDSSCHTLQPDVAATSRRVRGSARRTEEMF
jgi:hypothetical protein